MRWTPPRSIGPHFLPKTNLDRTAPPGIKMATRGCQGECVCVCVLILKCCQRHTFYAVQAILHSLLRTRTYIGLIRLAELLTGSTQERLGGTEEASKAEQVNFSVGCQERREDIRRMGVVCQAVFILRLSASSSYMGGERNSKLQAEQAVHNDVSWQQDVLDPPANQLPKQVEALIRW